eukprot:11051978-Prorocentrum_lima.AAC.1
MAAAPFEAIRSTMAEANARRHRANSKLAALQSQARTKKNLVDWLAIKICDLQRDEAAVLPLAKETLSSLPPPAPL